MHGIILTELQKYVEKRRGAETWTEVRAAAGLSDRVYTPVGVYPDDDVVALIGATAASTQSPVDDVLQDFGEFIVPDLVEIYGSLIDPDWGPLDLLQHTEETVHTMVRVRDPGSEPPYLEAERTAPDEVVITYRSPRRMCGVAKGIVRGVAAHYGQPLSISEEMCMLDGADRCVIVVQA